ncbi:MAG: hypothetical protein ACI9MR_003022 [Myxococcota bacterium]|jgi:hypothetical protein
MNDQCRRSLNLGLSKFIEALGLLADVSMSASVEDGAPMGDAVFDSFEPGDLWMQTRLLDDPDVACGIVMPLPVALRVSASMMMIVDPPEAMNEELNVAFDEAMNIAIGSWNDPKLSEGYAFDNAVEPRRIWAHDHAAVMADCAERGLGMVLGTLMVDGTPHRIAVFGGPRWLPDESKVTLHDAHGSAAPETEAALIGVAAKPSTMAAGGSADQPVFDTPSNGVTPAPFPLAGAAPAAAPQVVFVDMVGAFTAWLSEALGNPKYAFFQSATVPAGEAPKAVLIMHPADMASIQALSTQTIVVRTA